MLKCILGSSGGPGGLRSHGSHESLFSGAGGTGGGPLSSSGLLQGEWGLTKQRGIPSTNPNIYHSGAANTGQYQQGPNVYSGLTSNNNASDEATRLISGIAV